MIVICLPHLKQFHGTSQLWNVLFGGGLYTVAKEIPSSNIIITSKYLTTSNNVTLSWYHTSTIFKLSPTKLTKNAPDKYDFAKFCFLIITLGKTAQKYKAAPHYALAFLQIVEVWLPLLKTIIIKCDTKNKFYVNMIKQLVPRPYELFTPFRARR